MKLSIIIPTLNEAEIIKKTLLGLQDLRSSGHEVIVVDGGSDDDTRPIARPLVDRLISSGKGRAIQMNTGARDANGDVLLFLHADTCLPPQADQIINKGLQASNRVWGRFNVRLSGSHFILRIIERMMNIRSRLTGIATGDQAIFVRRDVFRHVGGFTESGLMEDIAISKKLLRHAGSPLCLHQNILTSSRRWEQHGMIKTILLMWRLRLAFFFGRDTDKLASLYNTGK